MRGEVLVVLRGNLTPLKDMAIVTLGFKAKDTQSLGTSYHSFFPIKCGLKASHVSIYQFLFETEEALKQGAKSVILLVLASLSHRAHSACARCIQVMLADSTLRLICLSP